MSDGVLMQIFSVIITLASIAAMGWKAARAIGDISQSQNLRLEKLNNDFKNQMNDFRTQMYEFKESIESKLDKEIKSLKQEISRIELELAKESVTKESLSDLKREIREDLKNSSREFSSLRDKVIRIETRVNTYSEGEKGDRYE